MNHSMATRGLIAVLVFQLLVLGGEYLNSVFPLWFGETAILKIRPVDPRSLFRGNYVRLDYEIDDIKNPDMTKGLAPLKKGDVLYVGLEEKDGYHQAKSISKEKPSDGLFIRGRVKYFRSGSSVQLKYGIEAYFAAKDRALDIEKGIRQRRRPDSVATSTVAPIPEEKKDELPYARIKILSSGKAALEDLQWDL